MSDRKYRHRGYQDDDRDRQDRRQQPRPDQPHRMDGAPRGRGLGAPTQVAVKCARCGHRLEQVTIEEDTTCPKCGDALHSCTNCTFFNPSARFECTREIPARIESKTKANRCDLFEPKTVRELGPSRGQSTSDPRAAFDALFKK